ASEVAVMHLGKVVEIGPTASIYRSPRHPYTLELLASAPGATSQFLTQQVMPSQASADREGACRFAYRCPLRAPLGDPPACLEVEPPLVTVGADHRAACHFSDAVA